jgi:FMN phosphatase YigB (HAD superfamily)
MKENKTLIIFDFDNTLFKTREFWREYLFPFYIKIGMARNYIESAFVKATTKKVDYFIPKIFIDELYRGIKEDKRYTKKQLESIFKKHVYSKIIQKYFYPYSLGLLEKARKKYQILLVSYGDKNFKIKFFNYCGLNKYFLSREIIVTDRDKTESLKRLTVPQNCIIIDDMKDEAKKMASFLAKRSISVKIMLAHRSLKEIFKKI